MAQYDDYRCTRCGTVRRFEVAKWRGTLCEVCGEATNRVRVGSFAEFYAWSVRDDVCEFIHHRADGVRRFTLVRRGADDAPPEPGTVQVDALHVKLCPEHASRVAREGFLGFVLPN